MCRLQSQIFFNNFLQSWMYAYLLRHRFVRLRVCVPAGLTGRRQNLAIDNYPFSFIFGVRCVRNPKVRK